MCGICGIVGLNGAAGFGQPDIARMREALAHRGPDDSGCRLSDFKGESGPGRVGLGHRRLSIIDLAKGHQPLSNEDGTVWIVFNGEIYNFQELRPALVAQGHQFRTDSDTEVIVHLYEQKGADCLQELRGMFAFAIWDAPRADAVPRARPDREKAAVLPHREGAHPLRRPRSSPSSRPAACRASSRSKRCIIT